MDKKKYVECTNSLLPVRDALEVINGKWKLPIIISIWSGNRRFREIERSIPKITTKVLAKELKDLEENKLIQRTVYGSSPVLIEYTTLPYAKTLETVVEALRDWGINHRREMLGALAINTRHEEMKRH